MIDPERLFQLEAGQKRRKLALTFGELERDIAGIAEKGTEYNFTKMSRRDYTKAVCRIVLDDPKLPAPEREQLSSILQHDDLTNGAPATLPATPCSAYWGPSPPSGTLSLPRMPESRRQRAAQARADAQLPGEMGR